MEATGRYHCTAESMLSASGLPVAVINPRQIKNFARAVGRVVKSDPIDARIICEYGRRMVPQYRPAKSEYQQHLATLLMRRSWFRVGLWKLTASGNDVAFISSRG